MTNDSKKWYTYPELADIFQTDHKTVGKKVKKYKFKTDKQMVNGRLLNVVLLSIDEVEALNHEIDFNRKKKLSPNYQPMGDNLTPNSQPQLPIVQDNQFIFNALDKIYRELIIEKDEKYNLLQESYKELQNLNNELSSKIGQLEEKVKYYEEENQKLKGKWWNKPIFK